MNMKQNIIQINLNKDRIKKHENELTPNIIDKYNKHIDIMKSSCSSFAQIMFSLSYPQSESIKPKYEHIQIFNYYFKASLIRKYCQNGQTSALKVIWIRNFDTNHAPQFHYLILINGESTNLKNEVTEAARTQWGLTLGVNSTNLIHLNAENENILNGNLIFNINLSQAKQAAMERLMFRQAQYLAQLVDHELLQKGA